MGSGMPLQVTGAGVGAGVSTQMLHNSGHFCATVWNWHTNVGDNGAHSAGSGSPLQILVVVVTEVVVVVMVVVIVVVVEVAGHVLHST